MLPSMSETKGVELRAQMDIETVKGLLLLHGGGALASLTFLSTILNAKEGRYVPLAPHILVAVLIFTAGLVCVIKHNVHRRECSRVWDQHWQEKNRPSSKPAACARSERYRAIALWLFPIAIFYIVGWAVWFLLTLPATP
jgi:hypothetical protein